MIATLLAIHCSKLEKRIFFLQKKNVKYKRGEMVYCHMQS